MARKTLKLPEDEYDRHNERRKGLGLSWPEYIDGQAPDVEYPTTEEIRQIIREEGGESSSVSNDDLQTQIQALREELDRITPVREHY